MSQTKVMTVALINVMKTGDLQYEQEIPLGLAYMGSFLQKQLYSVIFKQCFAGVNEAEYDSAANVEADVYGFQLTMGNFNEVRSVAARIKARKPNSKIICGGPFLVSLSKDVFKNEPLFDFFVIGEGEYTVLELLHHLENGNPDYSDVNGLWWRNGDKRVIENEHRKFIDDLDSLPFPSRTYLEAGNFDPTDKGLLDSVRIVTSRGCVGNCSFCCVNINQKIQKGKVWRGRSPENIVDELEFLSKRYKAKLFNFSDSSFDDPGKKGKDRSRQICESIIQRNIPLSAKIYLRCETMKTEKDVELLKLYKKAGIDVIIIGVESGSDYELRLYEKRASVEDNFRIATILKELDLFYVLAGFIMFGPNSTMESLHDNINYMNKCGFVDNLMSISNVLMLVRGSKLYNMIKAEKRLIESKECWELPTYLFKDPMAERMTKHWLNLFVRYPVTNQVNQLQINSGNLVARMTNPMNVKVLDCLKKEFDTFKKSFNELSQEFSQLQYNYFIKTCELVENKCSDNRLTDSANEFFGKTYSSYLPIYKGIYNNFITKIVNAGFGLSGISFNHFISSMGVDSSDRVKNA
jgi:radical SAM superfamily enzyme YgiQ (UPF0313 family)